MRCTWRQISRGGNNRRGEMSFASTSSSLKGNLFHFCAQQKPKQREARYANTWRGTACSSPGIFREGEA